MPNVTDNDTDPEESNQCGHRRDIKRIIKL